MLPTTYSIECDVICNKMSLLVALNIELSFEASKSFLILMRRGCRKDCFRLAFVSSLEG